MKRVGLGDKLQTMYCAVS